jgi:hypothetical protein
MPRVLGLGQRGRQPSSRRAREGRRWARASRRRGARVVVRSTAAVASRLLRGVVPLRRACGCRPEGAGQACMAAVLRGPSRLRALVPEAERAPPDTRLREAAEGRRGPGRAVIGAAGPRQARLAAQALAEGLGLHLCRGESGRTAPQRARVGVCPREGGAGQTVAGTAWPFKIGRPDRVGRTRGERRSSRMVPPAPALRGPRPPGFAAERTGAAGGRHPESRRVPGHGGSDLPRPPRRLQALSLQPHGGACWSAAVWTGAGHARRLLEPRATCWGVPCQPLVPGLPAAPAA